MLIAIILPAQLGTVPLYIGARTVGLTGNAIGMILLWIGILLPLSVFLYASFFRGSPPSTKRPPSSTAPRRRRRSSGWCCR